jgi:hypothetical protein
VSGSGVSIELSAAQVGAVLRASASNGSRRWAGDSEHEALLRVSGNAPDDGADGSHLSRSLRRGLTVWVAFPADRTARGVGEVARELGMSRTTVHRYVVALVEVGLLEPDRATRRYRISRNLRG